MSETPSFYGRGSIPSASYIGRLIQCPGSWAACRGLADNSSPAAEFGTRVHAALAGTLTPSALTPEEEETFDACRKIEEKLVKQWTLRHAIPEGSPIHTFRDNKRLWLEVDGQKECSGLADVIHIAGVHALVLDYKCFASDQADASSNAQLRCLAVLVKENFPDVEDVDCSLIQPMVTYSPEVCSYDLESLFLAKHELLQILEAVKQPDAPLHVGPHCRYCRAASACPEVHREVTTMSALTIHATGLTVSDQELSELRAKCGYATKMIESIKAECFRRAQADPDTWKSLGWEIHEGSGKRQVSDIATVSERLHALGAPWERITASCSITLKELSPLVREATKLKGMKLKAKVDEVLQDCTDIKKAKASLKRIGEPEDEEE